MWISFSFLDPDEDERGRDGLPNVRLEEDAKGRQSLGRDTEEGAKRSFFSTWKDLHETNLDRLLFLSLDVLWVDEHAFGEEGNASNRLANGPMRWSQAYHPSGDSQRHED